MNGIPMGTNCDLFIADLFYSVMNLRLYLQIDSSKQSMVSLFNNSYIYVNNILTGYNSNFLTFIKQSIQGIYIKRDYRLVRFAGICNNLATTKQKKTYIPKIPFQ